jgi:hypothetical protein
MSAAAEYYGYLLSQGYGEEQIACFAHLADQANKGIISHNQAYRKAIEEGWNDADGEEKQGGFKEWLNKANEQGWIDKGLEVFGALSESGAFRKRDRGTTYRDDTPPPPPNYTPLYILGGLAVIGIGVAIYFAVKKK